MEGCQCDWDGEAVSKATKSFEHWLRHASTVRLSGGGEPIEFYSARDKRTHDEWEDLLHVLYSVGGSVNCTEGGERYRSTGLVPWNELRLQLSLQLYRLGKVYEGIPLQITFWSRFRLFDLVLPAESGTNHCLCHLNRLGTEDIEEILYSQKGRRSTTVREILTMAQRFDL